MLAVLVDHLETVEHGFQRFLIDVFEVATASEQRTGSVNGGLGSGLAMHEAGDLPGEGLLGLALAGVGLGFLDQSFDFGLGQEGERLQQAFHLHIRAVDPELVELVRAEHRGVEPDGVALGLAELLAGSISDDRAGEHIDVHTAHLVNQVQAGGEVAPLVGAAEFQRAVVFVKQVEEVVALQHLIAELGEGDAFLGVQAASHGVFGQHGAQAEVLADIAQEVDDGHRSGPIVVGHETHRVGAFSLQNTADLVLEAVGPAGHHVLRIERTFT